LSAADQEVSVQGNDLVLPEASPGATNIADNDTQATAWDEDALAFSPDLVELFEKRFVLVDVAKLAAAVHVLDQVEVRRRGHDQVDGLVLEGIHVACVAKDEAVMGLEAMRLEDSAVDPHFVRDGGFTTIQVRDPEFACLAHSTLRRAV
jgi:hypothetical protein